MVDVDVRIRRLTTSLKNFKIQKSIGFARARSNRADVECIFLNFVFYKTQMSLEKSSYRHTNFI